MELYFLGTAAGAPARERNVSSTALRFDQGRSVWLFDCGEATQHQILRAPFSTAQITHIFITHLHGDHLFGLPGLLSTRSLQGGEERPLTVLGPVGIAAYLRACLEASSTRLGYELRIAELPIPTGYLPASRAVGGVGGVGGQVTPAPARQTRLDWPTALEDDDVCVHYAPLRHGVTSLGYAILERDKPGRFRVEWANDQGVPAGPLYGKLKRGETITMPDGRVLRGADFTEPPEPGRKVVILGDTAPCAAAVSLAMDADVLVHEATFSRAHAELASARRHSTAADAAQTAAQAGVRTLILTHISPRYQGLQGGEELLADARDIFPDTVLARDHWSWSVARR